MFRAIVITKDEQGYRSELKELDENELPDGDVTVRITHSSLNYKDALAITGEGPVVREFPMIPGIDFSGTVEESRSREFSAGDRVILNGWGAGERFWGGMAEKARVRAEQLISLPEGLTPYQAMAVGTAGYTAMLCVMTLERLGITPDSGPVLVTGATGGVGSVAVSLLAKLGYRVDASTGRPAESGYLQMLGASGIIDRAELSEPGRPLQKQRWAGAVDTLGSHTLANVCASVQYGGAVAACGLAQGGDLPATVMPFILRGVTLAGVDSVMRPRADRIAAWRRLSELLDRNLLEEIGNPVRLEDAVSAAGDLLAGRIRGRMVVTI